MTIPPIHLIARALRSGEQRTAVLTNNIANVNTNGFKAEMLAQHIEGGEDMPKLVSAHDLRQGVLHATNNPADVALDGMGFMTVEAEGGERLTRGGRVLRRHSDGMVIDEFGSPIVGIVDGVRRTMIAPDGPMKIGPEGHIRVGDVMVGQIEVVWPVDPQGMERTGQGYFIPASGVRTAHDVRVLQGHQEASGVDHLTSLVEMISIQRRHGATLQTMRVLDGMLESAATSIGRVP